MEALGRLLNIVPTADGVEVNCADCSAVTFVCVGADTYTLAEATDAAGAGAATLAAIDQYYTNASAAGANPWVKVTQAAAGTIVLAGAVAVVTVETASMSAGKDYLRMTSTAAGLVIAIMHELNVQRTPANLPAAAV